MIIFLANDSFRMPDSYYDPPDEVDYNLIFEPLWDDLLEGRTQRDVIMAALDNPSLRSLAEGKEYHHISSSFITEVFERMDDLSEDYEGEALIEATLKSFPQGIEDAFLNNLFSVLIEVFAEEYNPDEESSYFHSRDLMQYIEQNYL